ncbi:MAG: cytochrome c [Actinobacteria bacterium]|nr:cytochrome c [Actinomycetota bacterium]
MFNRTARTIVLALLLVAATAVAGCGSQSVEVSTNDASAERGAQLFAERCAGCHTFSAAGAQGSKPTREVNSKDRTNGPNFDSRHVNYDDALEAIRQGGFSGAVMPGNIVTGQDAEDVATFVGKYSGKKPE